MYLFQKFKTEIIESIIESNSYNDMKDSVEGDIKLKMYPTGLILINKLYLLLSRLFLG